MKKKSEKHLIKNCFQCQEKIIVKYNKGTNEYIKKNNWEYWTENKKNQGKYICNSCLLNYYYEKPQEYLKAVENKKKRRVFTSYVYDKTIS
ncbi:MAG: hypothetical protein MRERV_86c003 [Mycoplasmataceae bacterium RV_VA103A]|nr:MAG: hypothetical protein MRERV_86c003 [Mycoplasmataceae bacterium RV_VA103A]